MHAKSFQLCPTLYNPMNCSLPGSPVHGILQAGILEWVAIPFSSDLSDPGIESGSPALQAYFFFYHLSHLGSPTMSLQIVMSIHSNSH